MRNLKKNTLSIFAVIAFAILAGGSIDENDTKKDKKGVVQTEKSDDKKMVSKEGDAQKGRDDQEKSEALSEQNEVDRGLSIEIDESKKEGALPIEQAVVTVSQGDRENVLVTLKEKAISKWDDDYSMIEYEYNNQVEAYDWVVAQTKYVDIMKKAKQKWVDDYKMIKYEYGKQSSAYEWVEAQIEHLDIMKKARQKWGKDYQMIKYEYNKQVEAFSGL